MKSTQSPYRQALEATVEEIKTLLARREILVAEQLKLDGEITKLRILGQKLMESAQVNPKSYSILSHSNSGITSAVTMILSREGSATTKDIRSKLDEIGLDTSKYTNALSVIHTVLRRLIETGKVTKEENMFHWNGQVE